MNGVCSSLRVERMPWYERWSNCLKNWEEKYDSQHRSSLLMFSKMERGMSIESRMETAHNRTTTWSFPMLMFIIRTRNSTQIPRLHKSVPRNLRRWTGQCPCLFFISVRTLSTTMLLTTQSCLDHGTRNCLMRSSKEANFRMTSACIFVPTVTDKSLAPEGCSAAYVLAPVPTPWPSRC